MAGVPEEIQAAIDTPNLGGSVKVLVDLEELDWLRWFHEHADFGPADEDVRDYLKEQYEREKAQKRSITDVIG